MFEEVLSFKGYILNEDNKVLKQTASQIADMLQSMLNVATTGVTELKADCDDIFSLIQTMIHGNWLKQQQQYLVPLQTVAYNIKLLSDGDKEAKEQDVAAILKSCLDLINNKILLKIKGPVNNLATDDNAAEDIGSDIKDKSNIAGAPFDSTSVPPNVPTTLGQVPPLGEPPEKGLEA
jgi:hypothetical protein